jgi:S1-C subfamily serine protease
MKAREVVDEVLKMDVDLTAIAKELDDDDDTVVRKVAPGRARFRAKPVVAAAPAELPDSEKAARAALAELVEPGRRAVRKLIDKGGSAELTDEETKAAEAIVVLMGRPAILIQDGKFFPPPEPWSHDLEPARAEIENVINSVGRVELQGHPEFDWVGTGWLAAEDVIITNRHVAQVFAHGNGNGKVTFDSGVKARIDFAEELNEDEPREFAMTGIIGIHDKVDLALLRVTQTAGKKMPPPLPIAAKPKVQKGTKVYAVGFPATDSRRNDPQEMLRIFASIFNVKRLQPGKVRSVGRSGANLVHDCSTLGGNSGSCLVDLASHQVIGLHFSGRYLEGNNAVAMWKLADDPLLKKAKIPFA